MKHVFHQVICFGYFIFHSFAMAQLPPNKALSSFQVAAGLKLELFASEPMFSNPTCMDIDEKGCVWVCESVNYRTTLHRKPVNRKEGDRIVILHDIDGDGKADQSTTFYQAPDFLAPLGIAVSKDPTGPGYKVYVCHSPHLYLFEDKNGDGKADGPPKILLTGFGGIDHDHGIHGIHFGPDGKLYFSVGDQGVKNLKDRNGKVWNTNQTDCKAGTIWRCNTDGTGLELLAHNFRNQYEPAVNSFGTMFVSDNDDDGLQQTRICHVMYGGDYGYWPRNRGDHHWQEDQPGVVHKTLRTGFGSPTGMCWYEGKLLHKAFSSQLSAISKNNQYEGFLLHTDAGPREVRLFGVRPKGAGYELDKVNLVTSTDNWFRPSDVCVAPDGSIFIADWYDPGVGGHGMGDTTRGRIYRLTHSVKNSVASSEPQKNDMLMQISSPCIATRAYAASKLLTSPGEQTKILLQGLATSDPVIACRCYWLLAKTNGGGRAFTPSEKEAFERFLEGSEPHVKNCICRQYCDISPNLLLLDDKLPASVTAQNWREFLIGWRNSDADVVKDGFYKLTNLFDGHDRAYLSALNIACGTDQQRRNTILKDFEKHFPEWNDRTAWLVWELRPPSVISKLGRKVASENMSPLQTELALGALAAASGVEGGESLLKLLQDTKPNRHVRAAALKTLLQHLGGKWSSLKSSFLVLKAIEAQMTDGEMLPAVVELVSVCERKDFQGFLDRLAFNSEGHPNQVRVAAIAGLGNLKSKESIATLTKLLIRPETPDIRKAVMTALGKIATTEAMKPLQTYFLNDKLEMEDRRLALESLIRSRQGNSWLLELHSKKELPESLVSETGRLLRNSPYIDLRNKALIAFPVSKKLNMASLPTPVMLAKKTGNPEQGKKLVLTHQDLACIKCHGFQGVGGSIGPDLSMIGVKGSVENLFESILTPDKAIADQYVQHVIETKDGVVMSGLMVEETGEHIILRDANGKDTKLAIRDIEKRSKSAKSLMPDNLAGFLTEDELVDVVAYLSTMKSPALLVDRWQLMGPFPNDEKDSGLDKVMGPDAGYDSKASYQGKSNRVEWKQVLANSSGYLDLAQIHGDDAPMSVSYLYAEVDAPQAGWGDIKLGSDDGVNVIFNDKLVFRHRRHEAAQPGRDSVAVEFKKGKNTLLLKVSNGNNPHGVFCTLLPPGTEPAKLLKP